MNEWTQKDYEMLRLLYLRGSPLKVIANELNRTVTAINKYLNRSGIRPKRNRKSLHASTKIFRKKKQESETNPIIREWFYFEEVIGWLENQGIILGEQSWGGQNYRTFQGRILKDFQVLGIANERRHQAGLPPFYVKGITQQ